MKRFSGTDSLLCVPVRRVRGQVPRLWYCLAAFVAVWVFLCTARMHAQQPKPKEYEVKAAYLYNFGRFVRWPADVVTARDNSFPICVLGQDPFGPTLDSTLVGETLDGKPVVVRRISRAEDVGDCRIMFISSTEENHLKQILAALDKALVLTVSDMPDFSRRGGMIQFVLEGSKVRFEINLASAEAARLTVSAELLKVAATVRKNGQPGD
jgi:YfiR/HmsC-like